MEDAPGGVTIVLDGVAPNGDPLIALGYIYRYVFLFKYVLKFLM